MTLDELIRERPARISVPDAAKIMDVTPRFIHAGLQRGKFNFGTAIKMSKRWSYYINTERFIQYMLGQDVGVNINDKR